MLPSPPWKGYSLLALALLPSAIHGEAIVDSIVTPLGETALLTHSHPAFGGLLRGKVVKPVVLTEQNDKAAARNLEAQLSDVTRLESFFGKTMESNFNVLKDSYATASCDVLPWSGDFWPTYKDGINVVWKDGEPSPAEKYATAFDLNVDAFMNGISLSTGVLSESYTGSSTCSSDSGCDGGSLCALRDEATNGFCIPTWYGLCHAWAAAAMFEAEPKCDVQKNNVTFHSVDMKALITQLYDGAAIDVVFTGARFNGPDSPEELDKYGRYEDEARRDINAAFFHIAVANILGKQRQSFIVDVSSGLQVWNQPVQKYEFLETEIVDSAKLSLEYFGSATYPFNDAVTYLAKCTTRLTWTAESIEDGALTTTGRIEAYTVYEDYEYCLELDENYTIIGGEWLGGSNENHPDFLWFPAAKPSADTVTDTGITYADVLALIDESLECVDVTISPDIPDTPSTKKPGSGYTKSPSYTKTPYTKTPATKTPPTKAPPTKAPSYPPATYVPETTAPSTYPPETYAPETTAPSTYPPETYAPETTAPSTYPPETYAPETTAPSTYPPETYAPETTAPSTYPPETYAPETTAPSTYPPETYAPETTAPSTYPPETYAPETTAPSTYPPETYAPETTAPSTYPPETYAPETTAPSTYPPETYAPETTAPSTYTPYPSLICYPAPSPTETPTTYTPSELPSSYPTETPTITEAPTYAPTSTPTETPVVTYAPTLSPTTYKPTSTPKATNPVGQANQSPTQGSKSKWYRRLGEFTLWW
ncbi:hypothetical protein JG688_00003904 [Phytophthora aleatoria]|uniref:Elicitor-like transglutaminase n=1 Tax=Phytophthora aleatoria TaxID=2496075 RepID=A0A8J5JA21_9STRA|nr:hypothetical protein JG688_00003904 [Phytophthora aleatoria]